MYCHTCGAALANAASYCSHCGVDLNAMKVDQMAGSVETTKDTLVWVIVGTTITLLGMALGALVLTRNGSIDEKLGLAFVILTFVALALVDAVLVWRLLHANKSAQEPRVLAPPNSFTTDQLGPAPAHALYEPREPLASVTEQTTRKFEPLPRDDERR